MVLATGLNRNRNYVIQQVSCVRVATSVFCGLEHLVSGDVAFHHEKPADSKSIGTYGGAAFPATMFVWIGFFLYLASCNQVARQQSTLRILGSLSISLNVLFVATVGQHLRNSDIDVATSLGKTSTLISLHSAFRWLGACSRPSCARFLMCDGDIERLILSLAERSGQLQSTIGE